MSRLLFVTLLAVSLASASPLSTSHGTPRDVFATNLAPLVHEQHPHGTVNGSYIIVLKDGVEPSLVANHLNFVQNVHAADPAADAFAGLTHVYQTHLKGYAGHFSDLVLDHIRSMPEVDYVERDQIVRTLEVERLAAFEAEHTTQSNAPWGLARVSHRKKLSFGTFKKYVYDADGGDGVDVYVIDTGINVKHAEFEGRASWGKTMPANDVDEDGNGHGTHCAGTIASRKYGVAKAAKVIAVKVLGSNGSGTMSDVMGGVDWAAGEAQAKAKAAAEEFRKTGRSSHKGSVANMSLGGGKSRALDDAVNRAVRSGMHFAVAAGNDNRDACNNSPAAAEEAITVGASTLGDERAYFSNHGPCVDVFAPGLNILSTYIGSNTSITTMSGTSMASPHTAGLLAYLLSIYPSKDFNPALRPDLVPTLFAHLAPTTPSALMRSYSLVYASLPEWASADDDAFAPIPVPVLTPKQLKLALLALATENALIDELPAGTPNLLIFNNATA
ncbi:peptidase S8/S53 domain-containing protein [Epithele typhae]|uniref:peptidase S8/S53 domain-containing protein n=1 Tax=Epithele typhae TaxID=378194 RepID=UPI002008B17E|nr:peptidase S8/S53 domain-containing protein [Epithele typhae]KAH9910997.1 peptidase S8/S53 domain-containing protein [Epithele typhae]